MHSNQSYNEHEHLKYLQQEVEFLKKQIQNLNSNSDFSTIYEYYINGIQIEKVKGSLQLGQLISEEIQDSEGVHRFYIGEIKITEIEDSGTVGLGVTEKMSKMDKSVAADEAVEEIAEIYQKITQLLAINELPSFFEKLSSKKAVLAAVSKSMDETWIKSEIFLLFYEKILKLLNDTIHSKFKQSDQNFDSRLYVALADSIEEKVKTLVVISALLQATLPGYFNKYEFIKITDLPISKSNVKTIHQILSTIKKNFQLEELPEAFDELAEEPKLFRSYFHFILAPLVVNKDFTAFFSSMKEYLEEIEPVKKLAMNDLNSEEQAFLFSKLIEFLDVYQKHIVLEYSLLLV
ncbi:hypothetical protein JOC75_000983 [Metabacillus crassostreae]|uniref:hypothetical protein n=1 Tax=Metabacillus crassostreae TaxID=929098 RepID=UPI00195E1A4F|nr:hypothetical protein [Metabacillus crassostreae]MBM7603013.1 hypothetical protein [Metabacillus crassostreae]